MNNINIFLTYNNIYEINKDTIILFYQDNEFIYKILYNRHTKKSKIYKIYDNSLLKYLTGYLSNNQMEDFEKIQRIHRNNTVKLFKTPDLCNVIQLFTSENRIIHFNILKYYNPINLYFNNRFKIYFDADCISEIDDRKMKFKIQSNDYGDIYLDVNYINMSRQMYSKPTNDEQIFKSNKYLRCSIAIICPKAVVWINHLNSLSKIMHLNQDDYKKIINQMLKSDSDFLTHDYIEELEYESDEE